MSHKKVRAATSASCAARPPAADQTLCTRNCFVFWARSSQHVAQEGASTQPALPAHPPGAGISCLRRPRCLPVYACSRATEISPGSLPASLRVLSRRAVPAPLRRELPFSSPRGAPGNPVPPQLQARPSRPRRRTAPCPPAPPRRRGAALRVMASVTSDAQSRAALLSAALSLLPGSSPTATASPPPPPPSPPLMRSLPPSLGRNRRLGQRGRRLRRARRGARCLAHRRRVRRQVRRTGCRRAAPRPSLSSRCCGHALGSRIVYVPVPLPTCRPGEPPQSRQGPARTLCEARSRRVEGVGRGQRLQRTGAPPAARDARVAPLPTLSREVHRWLRAAARR